MSPGPIGESSKNAQATQAVHDLFAHRFPKECSERQAREMWADLVEGKSPLWKNVPGDRRECIRCELASARVTVRSLMLVRLARSFTAFFVHFNTLILKRSHKHFSFRNCSVGNAFLAAARDMLGGLPGAIFIFRAVSDSQNSGAVLPVILTNRKLLAASDASVFKLTVFQYRTERITIAARLVGSLYDRSRWLRS